MTSSPQSKKEFFQVSGDPLRSGGAAGVNLNKSALCNPVVLYKSRAMGDMFLTLDVYAMPGTPMYVLVYCPICQTRDPNNDRNMSLTIHEDNKQIDLDHKAMPKFPGYDNKEIAKGLGLSSVEEMRGVISIEPFGCTWEIDKQENRGGTGISGGLITSCCNWKISIINNVARDE